MVCADARCTDSRGSESARCSAISGHRTGDRLLKPEDVSKLQMKTLLLWGTSERILPRECLSGTASAKRGSH